jgi:hypothetical protein
MDNLTLIAIAILVFINSIGIGAIIKFIASGWYKTNRHEELINSLIEKKREMKERIAEIEKKQNEEMKEVSNAVSGMKQTLEHLNKTLDTLSNRFENFFSRRNGTDNRQ